MIVWVLYDIVDDKARAKTAKTCMQAGLYRVQFSCFLGSLTPNEKDTLQLKISDLINEDTDRVYVFPMSRGELQQTALLGQAFDKKLVTDEVRALFF